jgi:hypothetical protein
VRVTPKFIWGRVKYATWYQLEYDVNYTFDSNAGGPLYDSGQISATSITPPPMAKGIYFWRVRAGNATTSTLWSVPRTLQVALPLPGKLSPVSPRSGSKIPGGAPALTWNLTSNAAQYEVQVSASKLFPSPILWSVVVPDLTKVVDPALPPGIYYWRVRGLNSDLEPGPWTSLWVFSVPTP